MRTWWGPYIHFSPNMKMLQVVIASCCKVSSNSERWFFWSALPIHHLAHVSSTGWKVRKTADIVTQKSFSASSIWASLKMLSAASSDLLHLLPLCICLHLSVVFKVRESHENADYYHAHLKHVRLISRVLVSEFEHKPETACSRTPRKHQGPAERAHTRPSRSTMKHHEVYQFLLLPWSVPNFYCV